MSDKATASPTTILEDQVCLSSVWCTDKFKIVSELIENVGITSLTIYTAGWFTIATTKFPAPRFPV